MTKLSKKRVLIFLAILIVAYVVLTLAFMNSLGKGMSDVSPCGGGLTCALTSACREMDSITELVSLLALVSSALLFLLSRFFRDEKKIVITEELAVSVVIFAILLLLYRAYFLKPLFTSMGFAC